MKNLYIKSLVFTGLLTGASLFAAAQTTGQKIGTNPTIKDPSALLELEATNKGALLPRVALKSITDLTTIPLPANSLTVYNTATSALADYRDNVTPGYYYYSTPEAKWVKLITSSEQDLRKLGRNHISSDAGFGSTGTYLGTGFGQDNIAIGFQSLNSAVKVDANVAIGSLALTMLTTGKYNTAIGRNTLKSLTLGEDNNAIGWNSLTTLTSGLRNLGIGVQSLAILQTGSYNLGLGWQTGGSLLNGSNNLFLGNRAGGTFDGSNRLMIDNTGTSSNTPLIDGDFSTKILKINNTLQVADLATAASATTGNRPVVADANGQLMIGTAAATTTASNGLNKVTNDIQLGGSLTKPTIISSDATNTLSLPSLQTGIATDSILVAGTNGVVKRIPAISLSNEWHITGNSNTDPSFNFLGTIDDKSLIFKVNSIRSGLIDVTTNNTSFGMAALNPLTTADNLTAIGKNALRNVTIGINNTAIGTNALQNGTTVNDNTAVGSNALAGNVTGFSNTALGSGALQLNTSSANTALGTGALKSNTTGSENTAVGAALVANTTGTYNTAVGRLTLASVTNGYFNTAMGRVALQNAMGAGNTAFGESSGAVLVGAVTTADNNTLIGRNAGYLGVGNPNNLTVGNNNIALGYSTGFITPTGSNQLNIGNSIFGTGLNGSVTAPSGNIGINTTAPSNTLHVLATANPVRFEGLQSGSATDKIVVADAAGVLKTITAPNVGTAIETKATSYTLLDADETILVDASAGDVTITLPAAPIKGKKYNVKKIDNSVNAAIVSTGSAKTIDGNTSISGTLPYQGWVMQYDGTNWFIISRI